MGWVCKPFGSVVLPHIASVPRQLGSTREGPSTLRGETPRLKFQIGVPDAQASTWGLNRVSWLAWASCESWICKELLRGSCFPEMVCGTWRPGAVAWDHPWRAVQLFQ